MEDSKPLFEIGTQYKSRSNRDRVSTVIDILETRSIVTGKQTKIRYVSTHEFCGQIVTDYDVLYTTIKRGLI